MELIFLIWFVFVWLNNTTTGVTSGTGNSAQPLFSV